MVANGLVLVNVADSVCKHRGDRQYLDFRAFLFLRNGIREDHFREF